MTAKTNYISKLASKLIGASKTMTFDQLASDLNANGFKTSYGTPYQGGRGVAKLIHSVFVRLDSLGLTSDRDNVARAFTNSNGDYSYD